MLDFRGQAPVVQMLDSVIHRINHYPADKYGEKQLHFALDKDFSSGYIALYIYPPFEQLAPGLKTGVENDIVIRIWRTGRHTPTKNS